MLVLETRMSKTSQKSHSFSLMHLSSFSFTFIRCLSWKKNVDLWSDLKIKHLIGMINFLTSKWISCLISMPHKTRKLRDVILEINSLQKLKVSANCTCLFTAMKENLIKYYNKVLLQSSDTFFNGNYFRYFILPNHSN